MRPSHFLLRTYKSQFVPSLEYSVILLVTRCGVRHISQAEVNWI